MEIEIISLDNHQYSKVSFYSVQIVGNPLSEFGDFMNKMKQNEKDWRQAGLLNTLIRNIGKLYGAKDQWFRSEGRAEGLPHATFRFFDSDGETDFGLRLYCLVLSEQVVILLNGDRKTTQSIKHCPNCYPHFQFANKLSDAIHNAFKMDLIVLEGKDIMTEDDFVIRIPE